MNRKKVLYSLAGFAALAAVSYHQVRTPGPHPRDTAIMSGTVLSERATRRAAEACDEAAESGADTPANCPEPKR